MDSLHDDLYFVLFSFLQDKVTFIILCYTNKKFHQMCYVYGKMNNLERKLEYTKIAKYGYLKMENTI